METILGDVLTWSWFSEPHGYNFNSLLIRDPRGNICVDPVEPNDQVLSELVRLGVSRILSRTAITCAPPIKFESAPAPAPTFIPTMPHTRKGRAPCSTASFARAKRSARSK